MTNDAISKFVEANNPLKTKVKIDFKQRSSMMGVFVKSNDYDDLKSKNFWRIVVDPNVDMWRDSRNINLAKIFNGMEITRLTSV